MITKADGVFTEKPRKHRQWTQRWEMTEQLVFLTVTCCYHCFKDHSLIFPLLSLCVFRQSQKKRQTDGGGLMWTYDWIICNDRRWFKTRGTALLCTASQVEMQVCPVCAGNMPVIESFSASGISGKMSLSKYCDTKGWDNKFQMGGKASIDYITVQTQSVVVWRYFSTHVVK